MRFIQGEAACACVIPTRDRSRRLLATLEKISQTPGPDIEVVVLDNGSIDDTPQKVRDAYPDVTVIEMGKNLGTAARNVGAEQARSPVILMLDDDSGPLPGTVERIIEALADPSIGAVACRVLLPGGAFEEGGSRHVFIGCGAAFRKKVFLDIGGYDLEYETYVEEYDVSYRILANGLTVQFVEGCDVWHEPEARDSFDYMVEKLTANNAYLAAKYYPFPEAAEHVAWNVYRYGIFARQKSADAGYRRAMEMLPEKLQRGLTHRSELPAFVLQQIIPRQAALSNFIELTTQGVKRIAFFRAGKEIPGLIQAACDAKLEVTAIFEPAEGLLADVGQIHDVPVRDAAALPDAKAYDRIVIGGTSEGFVANSQKMAESLKIELLIV